jgi:hypothetical protein
MWEVFIFDLSIHPIQENHFSELLCVFMRSELAASEPANNTAAAVTASRSYSHLASGFHSGHRTPVLGEVFSLWQLITAEHAAKWDY